MRHEVPGNRWDLLDGVAPATAPRVSVVVLHFEQAPQLARTLEALAGQTFPADRLEVVVADDGSAELPDLPAGTVLARHEDRGYRAAATRNLGVAHATGDVLVFLDADTTPEPGFVEALTRLPALAPDAVTVGRRRYRDTTTGAELPIPQWLVDGYAQTRDLLDADDRSYRYVISSVLACSRELWDLVGGFDESFEAYGGEDWEWGARAWLAGAVLAHVPDAVAWHDGPDFSRRDDAGMAKKDDQTLRLARTVMVGGSRPRGLVTTRRDVEVRLGDAPSRAAAWLCVDSVLAALPQAAVVVAPEHAGLFTEDPRVRTAPRGARVEVDLPTAVRVTGTGLAEAVARVGDEQLAELSLVDHGGMVLARLRHARAVARQARWGRAEGFPVAGAPATGLRPVPAAADVEAYLGGW